MYLVSCLGTTVLSNEVMKMIGHDLQDDKITQDEWFRMWTECVSSATNNHRDLPHYTDLPEWQQKYMDFMFEVNDTSG